MRKFYMFQPDKEMVELDEMPYDFEPFLGAYIYEPADKLIPWVHLTRHLGDKKFVVAARASLNQVPALYRTMALLLG